MDTRYTAYDIDQQREAAPWDASDLAATPAVVAAFNDYLAKQLHYSTPLEYLSLIDNRHLNLPAPLRSHLTLAEHEAGHMMYIDPASLTRLKADLDAWYAASAVSR